MSLAGAGSWTFATLLDALREHGDRPALISFEGDKETVICFSRLVERVQNFAEDLHCRGVVVGETVALLAPNSIGWVIARLAVGAIGAVALALDDLATDAELITALAETACRRVATLPMRMEALHTIDPGLDLILVRDEPPPAAHLGCEPQGTASVHPLPRLGSDAPAMVVYTSGTTGAAKCFMLTYGQIWANVRALVAEHIVDRNDRVLLPLPLHHVYPLVVGLLTPLLCGAQVVFPKSVTGPELTWALRQARVSTIVGVTRLYTAIINGLQIQLKTVPPARRIPAQGFLSLSIWLRRCSGLNAGRFLFRGLRARISPSLRLLVSGGARLEPEVLWSLVGLGV